MEARLEAWRRLRDQVERVGPAFTPPDAETMAYLRSAFALPSWFERMLLEVGYPERALEGHFFPPLEQVRRYVASLDDWDENLFPFDLLDEHVPWAFDLRDPARFVCVDCETGPGSIPAEVLEVPSLDVWLAELTALYAVAGERLDDFGDRRVLSTRGTGELRAILGDARAAGILEAVGIDTAPNVLRLLESKARLARLWTLALGAVTAICAGALFVLLGATHPGAWVPALLLGSVTYGSARSWRALERGARALKAADDRRGPAESGPFR